MDIFVLIDNAAMRLRQASPLHHALRSGFHYAANLAAARAGVYSFFIHICLSRPRATG
jgi:hypothetical protein